MRQSGEHLQRGLVEDPHFDTAKGQGLHFTGSEAWFFGWALKIDHMPEV
jgi:hypothetical protein